MIGGFWHVLNQITTAYIWMGVQAYVNGVCFGEIVADFVKATGKASPSRSCSEQ